MQHEKVWEIFYQHFGRDHFDSLRKKRIADSLHQKVLSYNVLSHFNQVNSQPDPGIEGECMTSIVLRALSCHLLQDDYAFPYLNPKKRLVKDLHLEKEWYYDSLKRVNAILSFWSCSREDKSCPHETSPAHNFF
jgi:hypothetical protein